MLEIEESLFFVLVFVFEILGIELNTFTQSCILYLPFLIVYICDTQYVHLFCGVGTYIKLSDHFQSLLQLLLQLAPYRLIPNRFIKILFWNIVSLYHELCRPGSNYDLPISVPQRAGITGMYHHGALTVLSLFRFVLPKSINVIQTSLFRSKNQ